MTDTKYFLGLDLQIKINGVWRYFIGFICNRHKTAEELERLGSEISYQWDFEIIETKTFSPEYILPITRAKKAQAMLFNSRDTAKSYRSALADFAKREGLKNATAALEGFWACKYEEKYGEPIRFQTKISKAIIGKCQKIRTFKKKTKEK